MHKQSFWIWHYGDYEIFHTMELNLRREVREKPYPPFWHLSTPNVSVKFTKDFNCENNTKITVHANGEGYISINAEKFSFNEESTFTPEPEPVAEQTFTPEPEVETIVETE